MEKRKHTTKINKPHWEGLGGDELLPAADGVLLNSPPPLAAGSARACSAWDEDSRGDFLRRRRAPGSAPVLGDEAEHGGGHGLLGAAQSGKTEEKGEERRRWMGKQKEAAAAGIYI